MLATPLAVGILASSPRWVHLPLTAFWFLGYFAFFAAGLWLKAPPRRRPQLVPPLRTYGLTSAAFGALTLVLDPGLIRWAPLFVAPLAVALVASARRVAHPPATAPTRADTMTTAAQRRKRGTRWLGICLLYTSPSPRD